jgi:N-acetylmuramoyl-L-alanine amidase
MLALLCLFLAADKPLAGAVIVVDPGHGGQRYSRSYTGGTRGVTSNLTESELNLRVGLALAAKLEAAGATVYRTRTTDRRLSREGSSRADELHARVDYFDRYNPHFFVSVHHNAGPATATGHTALYKHNAAEPALYEACARAFNDALEGAVPGPKRPLIGPKGNYHVLRETDVPGTITEAGFQTNPAFDAESNKPEFPEREAAALFKGAVSYWSDYHRVLMAHRGKRDPKPPGRVTATALDPAFQAEMGKLLGTVAPGGKYNPAKAADYVAGYKGTLADPAGFAVTAVAEGQTVKLAGRVTRKEHHDRLIDLFVAMGLVALDNAVELSKK